MIAYLLLSAPLRKRVQRVIHEATLEKVEDYLAVLTAVEEFGDDEAGLRQVLKNAELQIPAPGLEAAIMEVLDVESTSTTDWRRVARRPAGKRKRT